MAEAFKNFFNLSAIQGMAGHLSRVAPDFDAAGFIAYATDGLDDLELKERSTRITDALERFLPGDFAAATDILLASLAPESDLSIGEMERAMERAVVSHGILGWPVMPMADYVARHGQNQVELSLAVLKAMTIRSSSEFAIRPFLQNHTQTTLKTLESWLTDGNEHVRRLVSEGSRPRLPWGMRLNRFVDDPAPVVALLERLKDDPSEYVRRSVANSLNDISKDHADLVADIAHKWMTDASALRRRLVRHGLRTLIKAGHPGALMALGYGPAKVKLLRFQLQPDEVALGDAVEFEVEMTSTATSAQPLIIDYVVHHMRANGKTTAKVFKWKTTTLGEGKSFIGVRRHGFKLITTRRYYHGRHRVEILVNGKNLGGVDFTLMVD
jgi:3-methyladenine DNA glycosylase AlkC